MKKITINNAAFMELIGTVAVEITLQKQENIINLNEDSDDSQFMTFLKKDNKVEKKFLNKV